MTAVTHGANRPVSSCQSHLLAVLMWNVMTHEYESIRAPQYWSSASIRTALDYSLSLSWGSRQIPGAGIQWWDLFKPALSGSAEELRFRQRERKALPCCAAMASGMVDLRRVAWSLWVARVCANLQCLSKHKDEALPQAFLHLRYPHSVCLSHGEHD